MREFLYSIKKFFQSLSHYPVRSLDGKGIDYDSYWVEKRGDAIGTLTRWQRQRAELVLKHVTSVETLVDIGCGDGSTSAYLKKKLSLSRVVGVDVSSTALVKARANGIETILVGRDVSESMAVVPGADYYILFEFLEQVTNPEEWLALAVKQSKHGVFFSVPNSGYVRHRLRLLFGKFPLQWGIHPSEHVRFWTVADMQWWLTALGYAHFKITVYEGVPILNRIFPALFGQGLFVFVSKKQ